MSCDEIEALRVGLMNVLGTEDPAVREHAETELGEELSGPLEALKNAQTLAEIERHLDAALVDLEAELAETPSDDPGFNYLRGRVVAVRDAERAVHRITAQTESVLEGLGEAHHMLHETFPVEN